MTIQEMQQKILQLKQENDICILAHSYQRRAITEVADFTGDSYALAKQAQNASNKTVILCGVRFMAETVKILSPQKTVLLANADAGCPMAEQMDKDLVEQLKAAYPGYTVAAYINTTAELKTVCDVCVTSSSAVKILSAMPEKDILFIPDINLGPYIQKQLPEKNIKLVHGGCPTHVRAGVKEVRKAKASHPGALLLVHPECLPEVVEMADYVGSTSGIMEYAVQSDAKEFIICTESGVLYELQKRNPEKKFYFTETTPICRNMKKVTLEKVLHVLKTGENEVFVDDKLREESKKPLERMLELAK